MSRSNQVDPAAARRERRAAERRLQRASTPQVTARKPAWQSPMVLFTGGALVLGIAIVVALQLLPGGSSSGAAVPGTRTAAGILVPAIGTPANLAKGRTLGSDSAPLKLTVWSDFQCPACRYLVQNDEAGLIRDYVATGKLQVTYHDFILISAQSTDLAVAGRCADQQGKFWQYHDVVFANQGVEKSGWATRTMIDNMADAVGINRTTFDACLGDTGIAAAVAAETASGKSVVTSTPTLDFGVKVINGAPTYDQLKVQVDALLASVTGSPAPSSPAASQ